MKRAARPRHHGRWWWRGASRGATRRQGARDGSYQLPDLRPRLLPPDPPTQANHGYLAPRHRQISTRARPRPRLLYIFSGPARLVDGFAALAAASGFDTTEIDLERGGAAHDMRLRANRARVLLDLRAGVYCGVLIATPCTTFSIARGNRQDGAVHFGLRSARYPSGPPWLDAETRTFIDDHDVMVAFSAEVLGVALDTDIDFILENPAPRNDTSLASSWPERAHLLQIWDTAPLRGFR